MDFDLADLARQTGYTPNVVRDRVTRLSFIFPEDIRHGSRGKIIVGKRILSLLQRMYDLETVNRLSAKEALDQIVKELKGTEAKVSIAIPEHCQMLLTEKDKQIRLLEEEVRFLRSQLETMLRPALPSPWRRLFSRRRSHSQ